MRYRFPLDQDLPQAEQKPRTQHHVKAGTKAMIGQATLVSMLGMFLAKLTGFVREILIVPKFGYGLYSDAYINAFQIPDLFYELLIGGVVAAVVTPTLSSGIERNQEERTWKSVTVFMSVAMLAMTVLIVFGELFAPLLMGLITGAHAKDASDSLVEMTRLAVPVSRILFFQSFLMMVIALFGGVLSAYKRFKPLAVGPSLYNLFYMGALVFLGSGSEAGIRKVAVGVVFAALMYALFQIVSARRAWPYLRFSLNVEDRGFKRLLFLAIPTLISGSVLHLNAIIMNYYANGLKISGAVTSIRQCNTTWALPYAVFAASVGMVMLPNLAGFYAQKNGAKIRSLYTASLRQALYYVLPFALIFAVMNEETIRAIFQWDQAAYTLDQVRQTGLTLRWFCISMVAQTVVFITNQAFYARKVTRLSLLIGLMALLLNPLFLNLFVGQLGYGVEGIGMAHAAYSSITALVVFFLYKRHKRALGPYRLTAFWLHLLLIGSISYLVLVTLQGLPVHFESKILQLLWYGAKVLMVLATYYIAGIALAFREAMGLQKNIHRFLRLDGNGGS